MSKGPARSSGERAIVVPAPLAASYAKLLLFVCFVLAAGFAIGILNPPGRWY